MTGGTGYLGQRLIPALVRRGHRVRALARPGSERRLPPGAEIVLGDALDAATFAGAVAPADVFVHLIGTPHPSPAKVQQFLDVDLVSVQQAVRAAEQGGVGHFVYLSVAYPAPIMAEYIAVRQQGEVLIRGSGMPATFLRPFYVLGPGHWWPFPLVPIFALLKRIPATRDSARRLGPVSLAAMIRSLVHAVENPPATGVCEVDAPAIR